MKNLLDFVILIERKQKKKIACTPSGGYHAQEHTEL